MPSLLVFCVALLIACGALAQVAPPAGVSSDDISVADGLQLPTYGHVWALDTWRGMHELVRLRPPDSSDEQGFSLKPRHSVEFKGEAARIRLHDPAAVFYLRGVSGSDNGRSDLVAVHLTVEGPRRTLPKDLMVNLKQIGKRADAQFPGLVTIQQQRVGATDWYRLNLSQSLSPGEYALVPLPSSPGFADGEIFDFAIDPDAPENAEPLRSEQYRGGA